MAVTYNGTFQGMGTAGISFERGSYATIAAQTFNNAFINTPAVFNTATSDELLYAKSSATTGFTPATATASASGAGTTGDFMAFGRGSGSFASRLLGHVHDTGALDIQYGTGVIDTALTFDKPFIATPTIICGATSDEGVYVASESSTGFTPTETTGTGGTATGCDYIAVGEGRNISTVAEAGYKSAAVGETWIEIGTGAVGTAVTFAYTFAAVPKIVCTATGDNVVYASTPATTGFTPTAATCAGGESDTGVAYIAIGVKKR